MKKAETQENGMKTEYG